MPVESRSAIKEQQRREQGAGARSRSQQHFTTVHNTSQLSHDQRAADAGSVRALRSGLRLECGWFARLRNARASFRRSRASSHAYLAHSTGRPCRTVSLRREIIAIIPPLSSLVRLRRARAKVRAVVYDSPRSDAARCCTHITHTHSLTSYRHSVCSCVLADSARGARLQSDLVRPPRCCEHHPAERRVPVAARPVTASVCATRSFDATMPRLFHSPTFALLTLLPCEPCSRRPR